MSCFTYILRSRVNGDIYVGSTKDVPQRLALHNSGKVKSTKGYRPWDLLDSEVFSTRAQAMRHEKFLKTHQQKDIIKNKFGHVAK